MTDVLRPVSRGDPIVRRADMENALRGAAAKVVQQYSAKGFRGQAAPTMMQGIDVWALNNTGEDLGMFWAAGIEGMVFDLDEDPNILYEAPVILKLRKPTLEDLGNFVITRMPIKAGQHGIVRLQGVTPVTVRYYKPPDEAVMDPPAKPCTDHVFADILEDECSVLESSEYGSARILAKHLPDDDETEEAMAIVRLI